jgi:hypothetical protein
MNRSDWLTDELIQAAFERRAGRAGSDDLRETILTLSAASSLRSAWRLQLKSTMSTPVLRPALLKGIAAATVFGVIAVGAALFVTRPDQPAVGGPSPTPNATFGPSAPASPSAGPSAAVVSPRAAAWTTTGKMITSRTGHTMAMLLLDGRVLVVGGEIENRPGNSAELYDPGTGTWAATGSMVAPRFDFSATLLADGKVLVAGGQTNTGFALASAEVYDPVSGTWTATGAMDTARELHTATLLANGRVLVAGGGAAELEASAEVYDPVGGTWAVTGAMDQARSEHKATLLRDGKVLVEGGVQNVGGRPLFAELYDPISGTWTAAGSMIMLTSSNTATLLANGKVLVAGGLQEVGAHRASASAELYDPQSGVWSAIQGMVGPRSEHTATLLPDGRVLVTGGYGADASAGGLDEPLASAELFDPASGTWSATASMVAVRREHTATLLPDGRVLVASGTGGSLTGGPVLASAELYDPGSGN